MERVLKGRVPTCTLDDVRNFADTSVFWGADPSNSHPRHLSRFAYYPRGEKRQKSYEEERTCIAVDVRKSATAKLCPNYYFRVPPGGDAEFIGALMAVLEGKIPKFGDKKRMIELGTVLRKTECR
jgi:formylmethanofuran dehydrogenase subunit B